MDKNAKAVEEAALSIVESYSRAKWHVLVMEGPKPKTHEGCRGPDCDCWRKVKP